MVSCDVPEPRPAQGNRLFRNLVLRGEGDLAGITTVSVDIARAAVPAGGPPPSRVPTRQPAALRQTGLRVPQTKSWFGTTVTGNGSSVV